MLMDFPTHFFNFSFYQKNYCESSPYKDLKNILEDKFKINIMYMRVCVHKIIVNNSPC